MQIKIDLKIFLFLLIFVITRQIKIYAILMLFALIHELGHLVTGLILGLKIEEISVVPVGFSIRFKTESKDYNKKIKKANLLSLKKMVIAIAGPITNLIIIGIVAIYYKLTQMTTILKLPIDLVIYSNILIFIFNLLPLYPLDGGRILKELVHIFAGLYKSYTITNNIANIVIIILTVISSISILIYKNIAILIIIAYLWGLVIIENKKFNAKMDIWEKLKI
jgi:stage IV sporulation protein FB